MSTLNDSFLTLSLPGISCAGCVGKIEKALNAVVGVSSCAVNLAEKTARVYGTAESDAVLAAVAGIGFDVSLVESEAENTRKQELRDKQELVRRKKHTLLALGLSVPLMAYEMTGGDMTVSPGISQMYWGLVGLLTLAVLVISGGHFFRGFWVSLKNSSASMDSLVALGTGAAWLFSMVVVLIPEALPEAARHVYFEASAMIIGLINFGQMLELRAKGKTSNTIKRLLNLQAPVARLVTAEGEKDVPVETIKVGDIIRIRPGDSIPVDAVVTGGETLMDESMLTGEPVRVQKVVGDTISAGTLNGNGSILAKAEKVGSDTALAKIIALVKQAQNSKMPIAQLADKVASIFVPTVIVIALLAAAVWFTVGPAPALTHSLVVLVTVLIIACPCALGLATPMSVIVGVGKAAELGMLVRKGEALQTASTLTTVVLDKTGTITEGRPTVTTVETTDGFDSKRVLTLAAAVEAGSGHPLAESVVNAAQNQALVLPAVADFSSITGMGVQGTVEGQQILLGNERLMSSHQVELSSLATKASELETEGQTVVYLAVDNILAGLLAITDSVREDSADAIDRLHKLGLKVVMLTGDTPKTAKLVAEKTGIDTFHAQVLPEDKERYVRELQEKGEIVGMTGDGINDAPALARANVGLAIGAGADVAIETADITLMRSSLHGLADAVELSKATLKNIRQNLFGAFLYNSLGIPVAAGVLYPFIGMLLNPMVAGAAMALSSVTVVTNANRLRFFKPEGGRRS
ncbi:heavy metal translocating P-type ATPase [Sansalvadorimonas verongulae]|uniref:heavy metal translocating P-type ATPase n=1 Tax=Sansalvadorimonas verongulae TaxID=2172824 RepID=UPI0012BCF96B|nr:heavy metal translocating P-type ATPase [Sansalvadorimonas verongulae]MTI15154.1 copper-translocating P-type ATPase [Sansalvadorimonas verongulae]